MYIYMHFHFYQIELRIPAEGGPGCDLGATRNPTRNALKTLTTQ